MARRIAQGESAVQRVNVKASPKRRVSVTGLGEKLGAEAFGATSLRGGSPSTFAAIREEVFRRLRSKGGRPGFEGVERKKIPLAERDWKAIEQVADHISEPGFRPSAGQVASVLISVTLRDMDSSLEATVKRNLKAAAKASSHS
jgi:hypothetical protein